MKIKSFKINQFKGLKSVNLENCGNINAIVGKNNSGKSSILHAIDMAGLALSVNGWGQFQPKLEVKDLFADVGNFELALTYGDDSKLTIKATPDFGPVFTTEPTAAQRIKTVLVLPDVSGGMLRRRHHTPKSILDNVENREFGAVNALEILYAIKFYASKSEREMTPAIYEGLLSEIKRYFPDISDVKSDRTENDIATLTYTEYGRELDILYSGTGLKHFLDVLLKTTVSGAKVVLLDEPELGLHPDLQRRFVEYLSQLAKDKGVQFFLATHSQVLLNYADTIVYYRVLNQVGTRTVVRVDQSAAETLLGDLGLRPSDILNQDICLLVEGQTDVIYFEHVIRTLYKTEFQNTAIAILQYGGSNADGIVSGTIDVANIVPVQKNTFWIRDRDARPVDAPDEKNLAFKQTLEGKGLPCHIWSKREIEYYLPEAVLTAVHKKNGVATTRIVEIRNGDQAGKFRKVAGAEGLSLPSGQKLRTLLKEHLTSKEQLDAEVRGIVEGKLIPLRDAIYAP